MAKPTVKIIIEFESDNVMAHIEDGVALDSPLYPVVRDCVNLVKERFKDVKPKMVTSFAGHLKEYDRMREVIEAGGEFQGVKRGMDELDSK